jgi:hypothetical protein
MDENMDVAYTVASALIGPDAVVPWWAWLAILLLIFGRLLAPVFQPDDPEREELRAAGLLR